MTFDLIDYRRHFEALTEDSVYFDNASTTQKPRCVLETLHKSYCMSHSSIERGCYKWAEDRMESLATSRKEIYDFFHIPTDEYEFIETFGCTDSINIICDAFAQSEMAFENGVAVDVVSHHSNYLPFRQLAARKGVSFSILDYDPDTLSPRISVFPDLVSVTLGSNVTGHIDPQLIHFIETCHRKNAIVCLDAAQAAGHGYLNARELGADVVFFSAHKMLGLMGAGGIIIRKSLLNNLKSTRLGGGMIEDVETLRQRAGHSGFEAGTRNWVNLLTLETAIRFNAQYDINAMNEYLNRLVNDMKRTLSQNNRVKLYDITLNGAENTGIISFNVDGVHCHDIVECLARKNIMTRGGVHCAQPLFSAMKWEPCVRMSLYYYNTYSEADYVLDCINKITSK